MTNTIRSNYWLIDCTTADNEPELFSIVSTRPVTLADIADYIRENMTVSIIDIWTTDPQEIEFAGVEVLRI